MSHTILDLKSTSRDGRYLTRKVVGTAISKKNGLKKTNGMRPEIRGRVLDTKSTHEKCKWWALDLETFACHKYKQWSVIGS